MKASQKGFTLIELVVVIVILGIIGAVATARFQDLSGAARVAALQGVAAELGSSSAINYARAATGGAPQVSFANGTVNADNCTDAKLGGLLASNALPGGYTAAVGLGACAAAGNNFTCTINGPNAGTITVNLICTGV